jgi:predicted DNA-binding transcriptional regulator YafY
MLSTSTRLLRLIALLQSRRHWSGRALAQRLDIDVRSLRRDIERLRELGYPVHASAGVGGGYALGAGAELPPMLLDDDEAVAVAVALRAASASVGGLEQTTLRLLAKLDQLLPARLRKRASALHAVTLSLQTPGELPDADLLSRVASACRDRECLRFGYRDHGGRASTRYIEPLRLANYGRRWYLVAWDRDRGDWRTFRVERMREVASTGEMFSERPPPGDVAEFLARAISLAPFRYQARLRLRGPAQSLAGRIPSWCGVIEAVDAQSCTLRTGADSIEGLAAQILVAGVPFTSIEPAALKAPLRRVLARSQAGLR